MKHLPGRLVDFLVYSNLFIAGCAVAMVDQTYRFLLRSQVNVYFLLFVLFSTFCSYSFHWYLTSHSVIPSPRIKWLEKKKDLPIWNKKDILYLSKIALLVI